MTNPSRLLRRFTVVVVCAIFACLFIQCQSYDVLVDKDQACQQKWADVEANLQRRADLVPNLVATVKASAKHEEDTLEKVTQARAMATSIKLTADDLTDPEKMKAFAKAQDRKSVV